MGDDGFMILSTQKDCFLGEIGLKYYKYSINLQKDHENLRTQGFFLATFGDDIDTGLLTFYRDVANFCKVL